MAPFFKNPYVRWIGGGLAVVIITLIVAAFFLASMNSARSTGLSAPAFEGGMIASDMAYAPEMMGRGGMESAQSLSIAEPGYMPPPSPGGFVSELERYETTDYSVNARTNQFDALCDTLTALKADDRFDFRSLNSSLNNCNAVFFTEERYAGELVPQLQQFDGVTITRSTNSVTRHRQQLQGRADILEQQLASVNRSLATAETQFDEIAAFARDNNDASAFSEAIQEKLRLIDTLTSRKISLTSQLDSLYQQSAELEERLGVVQFTVSVQRSFPLTPSENTRKWEQAWDDLKDTYTDTLIGLTTVFGIFLLWTGRIALYLLVVLVVIRLLWKFVRFIWKY
jgi:hypothetical protein